MDLALHLRVLWRFRPLLFGGLVVALALAFFSTVTVQFSGGGLRFAYRQHQQWASYATLFVTQRGFDWGEAFQESSSDPAALNDRIGAQRSSEDRLTTLAILYARLAESDRVRKLTLAKGPIPGRVEAAPLPALEGSSEVLPLISIAGISRSKASSLELTGRATAALQRFITEQQIASDIPDSERVLLQLVKRPGDSKLLKGRTKTLPVVVFIAVMVAVIALIFVLENLRPRVPRISAAAPGAVAVAPPEEVRRTASS